MKNTLLAFLFTAFASIFGAAYAQNCGPYKFRNFSVYDTAFAYAWSGDTFQLAKNYPQAMPEAPKGGFPWEKVSFRTQPEQYLSAVLNYAWEGFEEAKFVGQNNKVRQWFHAPALDAGYTGREPLKGLVMDRTSEPKTFSTKQTKSVRNYSITYYNPEAAYGLGQAWCGSKPNPDKARFPIGSVVMKLAFTLADTNSVPTLKGSPEWEAYVEAFTELPAEDKEVQKVRLVQVDIAVRTNAKDALNGWVFGVYVFDGRRGGDTRAKLAPLGLQWGNDPGVTPAQVRNGEKQLTETWINTEVWNQKEPDASLVQNVGYGYRLQGPVGNPATSILSEHMAATWPPITIVPPSGAGIDSMMHWYRNVPSGQAFNPGLTSLDYALELREGFRNYYIANGADSLKVVLDNEVAELLGFRAPDRASQLPLEEEEEVIEVDEGLEGKNLWVFIGFLLLLLVLIGLLVWNFVRDSR